MAASGQLAKTHCAIGKTVDTQRRLLSHTAAPRCCPREGIKAPYLAAAQVSVGLRQLNIDRTWITIYTPGIQPARHFRFLFEVRVIESLLACVIGGREKGR